LKHQKEELIAYASGLSSAIAKTMRTEHITSNFRKEDAEYRKKVGEGPEEGNWIVYDRNFYGHAKVNRQNVVNNPPKQPARLGKDGFYGNVKNTTGKS